MATQKNREYLSRHAEVPLEMILKIMNFLFDTSYFKYNGNYYKQKEGAAIGNPASPILVNIVMEQLIQGILSIIPFEIPFMYIDVMTL